MRNLVFIWYKLEWNRVHAVTSIFISKSLSLKYMPQMSPTVRADYLSASSVHICHSIHRVLYLIVEAWPSTARAKFILRLIQLCVTLTAYIGSWLFVVIIFSAHRSLRSLMDYYSLLFWSELVVLCHSISFKI